MKALTIASIFGFMLVFTQSAFGTQDDRAPASDEFTKALSMARSDQDEAAKNLHENGDPKQEDQKKDGPIYLYEEDDAQ